MSIYNHSYMIRFEKAATNIRSLERKLLQCSCGHSKPTDYEIYIALKILLREAVNSKKETSVCMIPNTVHGICYNVVTIISAARFIKSSSTISLETRSPLYIRLSAIFEGWRHHSGSTSYPVPRTFSYRSNNFWEGKQLEYRVSLLKHSIRKLQKKLDAEGGA